MLGSSITGVLMEGYLWLGNMMLHLPSIFNDVTIRFVYENALEFFSTNECLWRWISSTRRGRKAYSAEIVTIMNYWYSLSICNL